MSSTAVVLLIFFAILLAIVGLVGAVVPGLAGPPFAWLAVLLALFVPNADLSVTFVVTMGVVAVVLTVLDYVVPSVGAKRFGGGKWGVWGCNIGLVLSLFGLPFGPQGVLGVFVWPFLGAFVGEKLSGKASGESLRAAFGSFLGMLTGVLLKVAYAVVALFFVVKEIVF